MTSLTRVQSSLDLLCQTAGALEASDSASGGLLKEAEPANMHRVSPSMTNLAGSSGAAQSPLVDGDSLSRSTSSQYLVGASPSQVGFATFDDEDAAVVVPSHPWALASGSTFNVREQYIESLRSSNRNLLLSDSPTLSTTASNTTFLLPARTSSFHPPPSHTLTGGGAEDGRSKDIQGITVAAAYDAADKNTLNKGDLLSVPVSTMSGAPGVALQSVQELIDQNTKLRWDLCAKDKYIESLLAQIKELRGQVTSLKSLPVGKISQIPVEDLLEIMHEYGSEVSEHALPPRKGEVQKASVVRQFRRWNPNFFQYFEHRQGKWVPKLGRLAELERRARAREANKAAAPQVTNKPTNSKRRRA